MNIKIQDVRRKIMKRPNFAASHDKNMIYWLLFMPKESIKGIILKKQNENKTMEEVKGKGTELPNIKNVIRNDQI